MLLLQNLYETQLKQITPIVSVPLYYGNTELNMNWFERAAPHYIFAIKKKVYGDVKLYLYRYKVQKIPSPFEMACVIHSKTQASDFSNWTAVLEKIVMDALQKENIIENDNQKHYKAMASISGECDKTNPRADFYVLPEIVGLNKAACPKCGCIHAAGQNTLCEE